MNDDFTTEYTMNIVNKVEETESDFIFETISPFCERIAQRKISKAELTLALLMYYGKTNWVLCSDRLPDEKGVYLVTYYSCYHQYVDETVKKVGIDTFRGKTTWAKKKYQKVIAWQPLPEACQVGKENEQ